MKSWSQEAKGFGARFRAIREGRGLTQQRFAVLCGLNTKQVSEYETGERIPSLNNLALVRERIGCTWDDLLGKPASQRDDRDVRLAVLQRRLLIASQLKDGAWDHLDPEEGAA